MSTLDIVFDRCTVYRLQASHKTSCDLFALMSTQSYMHRDMQNHPLHGRNTAKGVYHALLRGYSAPLQATLLPRIEVAVKWVRGRHAVERLGIEAGFYQNELRHLQGYVVPRFYGYYTANIEGVDVGCLVLEWCGGMITCSPDELQRILAACKLHDAGVEHGRLYDREGRHFVMGMDGTVRILDFGLARSHKCRGAVPKLLTERPGEIPPGCEELEDLEAQTWSPSGQYRRL